MYKGNQKDNQVYKFKEFNFKKGDVVRVLNKKALFSKGTYEYSRDLYKIVNWMTPRQRRLGKWVRRLEMTTALVGTLVGYGRQVFSVCNAIEKFFN